MSTQQEEHTEAVTGDEPSTSNQQQQQQHGLTSISPRPSGATDEPKMAPPNGPQMRIKRELNEITQNPPPNCSAEMHKEDLCHWRATILGPVGTVYEGGVFKLDIRFPASYPFRPPQIRFVTRIYHCNVNSRGVICLDVLDERWSPVMNIAKVLLSIWVLIGECNPKDPLVMGIANQYNFNRKEHDKIARHWTKRYAMPKAAAAEKQPQAQGQEQEQQAEEEQTETTAEEQAEEGQRETTVEEQAEEGQRETTVEEQVTENVQ
ncbi:ubiquitin-conjugating enzyme E2 D2 [Drosophila nasuta]|uniref:ubiquitin-conjugating enzyme E2 D2 n=1 Tax=Drosophila nasuta TaxID=42062 RepID=UPI00295F28B4|nr:ubiquitin-conjugating enzyme E2 D2 [Drosophila nasuta]